MYKSVNINFFITLKILSKLQELLCEQVKQNLFGEYMFCITLKDSFLEPKFFYFCLKIQNLDDSLAFIWKKIPSYFSMLLCCTLSFGSSGLNCEFIRSEYGFSRKFENIILRAQVIANFTLKISATNFADCDILQILISKFYF